MIKLDESDRSEILRYLGYRGGEISEKVEQDFTSAIELANKIMAPRFVWKLCNIKDSEEGLVLEEANCVLRGQSIRKHLAGCDRAILFCVTLGSELDIEIDRLMVNEPGKGVILNACGIAGIEKLADWLQSEIDGKLTGEHTGVRFSPGYGDLPLETQTEVMRALACEKSVGVRLNSNYLMNPQKSVTAIAGIVKNEG